MDRQKENLRQSESLHPNGLSETSDLRESHQMTLSPVQIPVEGLKGTDLSTIYSIEYHLTVRLTHETLSRRDLSLLLEVLEYQVVKYGCTFPMFLAMTDLYFRLLGNKRNAKEVRDKYSRVTCTVAEILISSLRKVDFPLDQKYVVVVGSKVRELLLPHLMSSRTYGSRYKTWRPEKFFVVRTVPVDIILERRKNSEPYSSYCKGYGESHPSAHAKKTGPSSELDGDGSNFLLSEEEIIFQRCTDKVHVLCEFLLIKYNLLEGKEL